MSLNGCVISALGDLVQGEENDSGGAEGEMDGSTCGSMQGRLVRKSSFSSHQGPLGTWRSRVTRGTMVPSAGKPRGKLVNTGDEPLGT